MNPIIAEHAARSNPFYAYACELMLNREETNALYCTVEAFRTEGRAGFERAVQALTARALHDVDPLWELCVAVAARYSWRWAGVDIVEIPLTDAGVPARPVHPPMIVHQLTHQGRASAQPVRYGGEPLPATMMAEDLIDERNRAIQNILRRAPIHAGYTVRLAVYSVVESYPAADVPDMLRVHILTRYALQAYRATRHGTPLDGGAVLQYRDGAWQSYE